MISKEKQKVLEEEISHTAFQFFFAFIYGKIINSQREEELKEKGLKTLLTAKTKQTI